MDTITKNEIKALEEKYDADNDTMPGLPEVTWGEYQLLKIIKRLEKRIAQLEENQPDVPSDEYLEHKERRERWAAQVEENRRLCEGR